MALWKPRTRWAGPLNIYLSLLIILLLAGVAVPLVWLSYERGRDAAVASAAAQMRLLTERTMDRYRIVFGNAEPIVTMVAVSESLDRSPPDDIDMKKAVLIEALEGSPYLDGIYAGYPDGAFIHAVNISQNEAWRTALGAPPTAAFALRIISEKDPEHRVSVWQFLSSSGHVLSELEPVEANYDPRARPWYQIASTIPGTIAVGPYATATTRALALTLAQGHRNDGRIVVGADVLLSTIARFLAEEKVSPRGAAFVLDGSGNLTIHSDPAVMDHLVTALLDQSGNQTKPAVRDPVLDAVLAASGAAAGDGARFLEFEVNGEPYIGSATTMRFSPLLQGNTLIVAAPLADFTAASERLLRQGMLISGLLVLTGVLAAVLVARLITRSLSALTDQAARLSDLDFESASMPPSKIMEINSLAGALSIARDAIETFALYVPRELVRKIIASSPRTAGAAAREEVTILFTDIRDFTTICEHHRPEEVVELLSAYFEIMNAGVERNNGTIVQFLGNSVYAMWNAPVNIPDHAIHACRCAIELAASVEQFNASQRAAGKPEFVTRFGLHTGPAVVGSVGAENRLQYTAMGDTVNVASRLEGINKKFGTTIIVSREVADRCGESFEFRPLGLQQAKGRSRKIELYELAAAQTKR